MAEQSDRLEQHSIPDLIGRLGSQLAGLWSAELALARDELNERFQSVTAALVFAGVALVLALLGSVALMITAIALLRLLLPLWAAALIVTFGLFTVAATAALLAKGRLAVAGSLLPRRALTALKEDVTWAKARLNSNNG